MFPVHLAAVEVIFNVIALAAINTDHHHIMSFVRTVMMDMSDVSSTLLA